MKPYIIITAKSSTRLESAVSSKMEEGNYVPVGGVAISVIGESFTQSASINLAQAMVLKEKKDQ